MEELDTNLENYKLQLQQVEAALTTNPDNEELLKLKSDLEEVITLTKDLIKAQLLEDKAGDGDLEEKDIADLSNPEPLNPIKKDWQPGDICMAMLVSDGQKTYAMAEPPPSPWTEQHLLQTPSLPPRSTPVTTTTSIAAMARQRLTTAPAVPTPNNAAQARAMEEALLRYYAAAAKPVTSTQFVTATITRRQPDANTMPWPEAPPNAFKAWHQSAPPAPTPGPSGRPSVASTARPQPYPQNVPHCLNRRRVRVAPVAHLPPGAMWAIRKQRAGRYRWSRTPTPQP